MIVEIKSGSTLSADRINGLLWWTKLAGVPSEAATLVYGGDQSFTIRGVSVRPWFAV